MKLRANLADFQGIDNAADSQSMGDGIIRPGTAPAPQPLDGFGFSFGTLLSGVSTGAAVSAPAAAPTANTPATIINPMAGTAATPSWISSLNDAVIKADMTAASAGGTVSETAMLPAPPDDAPPQRWQDRLRDLTGQDIEVCPCCGGRMVTCGILKPQPPPRPSIWCDSS